MSDRQCEVCGHQWKSREGYDWIVLCPKCKISGYHMPGRSCRSRSYEPLYGLARILTLNAGLPWTDPRTGKTEHPKKAKPKKRTKSKKRKAGETERNTL